MVRRVLNKRSWVSFGANQLRAITQGNPEIKPKERIVALGDPQY